MQHALALIGLVVIGFGLVLMLAWLVPFNLLLRTIQRRHPVYYQRIGQPYTWLIATDFSLKNGGLRLRRGRAWWRYLRRVYRHQDSLPHDTRCRRLARTYRTAMRAFVLYSGAVLLLVVPLGGLAFALGVHPDITWLVKGSSDASVFIGRKPAPGDLTVPATVRSGSVVTQNSGGATSGPTTLTPGGYRPPTASTPSAPSSDPPLTRADLTSVFASIAPVGQKHGDKQSACQGLVDREPLANDLGPSGAICTDANLSTYSTY